MRCERIEQDEECLHGRNRNRLRVDERVYENHHLRNGGVERERLDVFGHFLDRGVQDFLLRLGKIDIANGGRDFPFASLVLDHHQSPDARQKPCNAFDAAHAPRLHLFKRPHEHLIATKRIRAVLLDHVVGIYDVAA